MSFSGDQHLKTSSPQVTLQCRGTQHLHTPPKEPWNWQAHLRILLIPKCLHSSELFIETCAVLTHGLLSTRFTALKVYKSDVTVGHTDRPPSSTPQGFSLETLSFYSVHILFRVTRQMSNRLKIRNRSNMSRRKSWW